MDSSSTLRIWRAAGRALLNGVSILGLLVLAGLLTGLLPAHIIILGRL